MEKKLESLKNRIVYADILRIIATFAVIILHVSASKWYDSPVREYNWQILNIYDSLVRWSVPIFVMLSGVFFLNPNKEIDFKKLLCKYILRIVLAIIFWGLFYQFVEIFAKFIFNHETVTLKKIIVAFAKILFGPPWYHLWYLYMLIGLYLLTPLYRIFTKNATEKQIQYLLILFFLFGLCLPFIKSILILYNKNLNINFGISELANYSGYFFAGYYFSTYSFPKRKRIAIYFFSIFSFLFTVVGTSFISMKNNKPNTFLYNNLLPTTMFMSFGIFIFIKSIFEKKDISEKSYLFISMLSHCTFGIFLIHDFIRTVLLKIGITADFINPLFAIPITSCLIFCISFLIIFVCKKTSISKYIL